MPRTTGRDESQNPPDPHPGGRARGAGGSQKALAADAETARSTQRPSGATTDPGAAPPKAGRRSSRGESRPEAQVDAPGRHGTLDAEPPAYDDIARRAYELYQQRGGSDGQEVDDWLRAEAELRTGRGRRDDEV